jgi:hypothetical protein
MNRPPSLIIVAGLFILVGAEAGWQTIAQAKQNAIFINPIMLCLFIGIGLLRHRPFWRYIALICVWFLMVTLVITIALNCLFPNGGGTFMAAWNALHIRTTGTGLGLALMLLVLIWMRWVLARKDVHDLFSNRG